MTQLLFVHGACHGAWCWDGVLDRLPGASAIDLPFTSFEDDVTAVRAEVDRLAADGPVTLVGHSYGGLVITAAGHRAAQLVYVAARMPEAGEVPAARTDWNTPEFAAALRTGPDGALVLGDDAVGLLYGQAPAEVARLARARWRPQHSAVPAGPVADPAWYRVPSTYVVCLRDRAVQVASQRACAARADAAVELDTDHSPFLSAPDAIAESISRTVSVGEPT